MDRRPVTTRVPMNPIEVHDNSVFAKPERYPGFERWWHRVIVAVELMVTFNIICGLLGLFGTGPLSTARVTIASPPVSIAYERITRRSVQSEIIIRADGPLPDRNLEILLPQAFGAAFEVVATSPPARDIHAERDGNVYAFDFGLSHQGEARFSIKPRGPAYVNALMRVGDGTATLRQIVLP